MEKEIKLSTNGFLNLFIGLVLLLAPFCLIFKPEPVLIPVFIILPFVGIFWLTGLFIVQPNQTKVLVFFGKYQGTVKGNGFFLAQSVLQQKDGFVAGAQPRIGCDQGERSAR